MAAADSEGKIYDAARAVIWEPGEWSAWNSGKCED